MKILALRLCLLLAATYFGPTSGICEQSEFPFHGDRIAVPSNSPIQYSRIDKKYGDEPIALFSGKFLLSGTYYYGDNDFNDSGQANPTEYRFNPQAYLIPDDEVAERLPYFVARNSKKIIFLDNPETFAKVVVPQKIAVQVRCDTCGAATGHVAIWVDRFTAGIACDKPDYEAHFLSAYKAAKTAIVATPPRSC